VSKIGCISSKNKRAYEHKIECMGYKENMWERKGTCASMRGREEWTHVRVKEG